MFSKKNKIKFYNRIPSIAETYPIIEAKNVKRPWLEKNGKDLGEFLDNVKKCPISKLRDVVGNSAFISRCPGIRQFMNTGYIITNPVDFYVETYGDRSRIEVAAINPPVEGDKFKVSVHPESQMDPYSAMPLNSVKKALKITTGWNMVCPKDYLFLVTSVYYNNEPRFTSPSGILDPLISNQVNVFLYWNVLEGRELVKAGTPIAQYIPIPRNLIQPEIECLYMEDQYLFDAARNLMHNYRTDAGRDNGSMREFFSKIFKKFY
jgi:hypothetical protein